MAAKNKDLCEDEALPPSKKRRIEDVTSIIRAKARVPLEVAHDFLLPTAPTSVAETFVTATSTSRRPKKYLCTFEGCDKAFDRPVRLQAHKRTHTNDRPFICQEPDCNKAFFKAEHLKAHFNNKHEADASYVCAYVVSVRDDGEECECGKAFTTATRLRRHLAAHEQKEQFKCQEIGCGIVFRKMETLQRHIKKDHLHENAFRCSQIVFDEGTEIPDECGQEFASAGQLKSHENREHGKLKYFCEICSGPEYRESHDSPSIEMDFINELSRTGFATYAELQAHTKSVHPPTCNLCGHACESKRALTAHMDIEHSLLSERQKYPCTFSDCNRSFTRPGNLKVHIQNVHVKNKKFLCGQYDLGDNEKCPGWDGHGCGMAFGTKANLENHTRTQHLQLPSLLKRRTNIKGELDFGTTPSDFDEPAEIPTPNQALSLLTGHNYDQNRPISCWEEGCDVRFSRNYDLAQHMELRHGWYIDDINDRLADEEALSGDQFWIGGEDIFGKRDSAESHLTQMPALLPSGTLQFPRVGLGVGGKVDDFASTLTFEEGCADAPRMTSLDPALRASASR